MWFLAVDTTQVTVAVIGAIVAITTTLLTVFGTRLIRASSTEAKAAAQASDDATVAAETASQEAKDYARSLVAKNAVIDAQTEEISYLATAHRKCEERLVSMGERMDEYINAQQDHALIEREMTREIEQLKDRLEAAGIE